MVLRIRCSHPSWVPFMVPCACYTSGHPAELSCSVQYRSSIHHPSPRCNPKQLASLRRWWHKQVHICLNLWIWDSVSFRKRRVNQWQKKKKITSLSLCVTSFIALSPKHWKFHRILVTTELEPTVMLHLWAAQSFMFHSCFPDLQKVQILMLLLTY